MLNILAAAAPLTLETFYYSKNGATGDRFPPSSSQDIQVRFTASEVSIR